MQMKSVILRESGLPKPYASSRPLSVETVDLTPPGNLEVLVKIKAAGVCHSDLSAINGDRPRPLPVALGHEASGIVEEIGPGVDTVKVGDHVVMSFLPICGHCDYCAGGRASLCEPGYRANAAGTLLNGSKHIRLRGYDINHHSGVSAFSEYAIVSAHSVVKITKDVDVTMAALFGCAVMTGVGAVVNTCGVKPGQSVAVIGLGGVGLSAVLGAVASGASEIVAIDLMPEKLELARSLGATRTFLATSPDMVGEVKEATRGGVDYAIEMAGSSKAFETAYGITRRGGTTATAGLANVNTKFEISPLPLVGEERIIKGSYMGSCVPSRDIPRYIDLFLKGRLPVERLLSSTGPLEEINEAFDRLDRGEVIRHLLVP
ncbi:Zn-dependent alcohol dehydrogenase GroES-like protein (plasmid) [Rhizobium etli bv. mimosae str. IE4771]|uniref:Zn-dependent alcohol dehydrogenase GroES-like protein n=1 Tax=Rhizobium etli bv. mimosae str. IE4771 TaxID=1432050 RepID=A0A060IC87_RHIET|nr:zinc-dependent alcohol dehydrogenase family protein [Rhizobium sp. IE4771]AIC29670.1 Zn-dependent alcohol dehydrogenase GroES-like protein [Rhizobium sp. IE4771]